MHPLRNQSAAGSPFRGQQRQILAIECDFRAREGPLPLNGFRLISSFPHRPIAQRNEWLFIAAGDQVAGFAPPVTIAQGSKAAALCFVIFHVATTLWHVRHVIGFEQGTTGTVMRSLWSA